MSWPSELLYVIGTNASIKLLESAFCWLFVTKKFKSRIRRADQSLFVAYLCGVYGIWMEWNARVVCI